MSPTTEPERDREVDEGDTSGEDEPFTRYQNPLYRLISLLGAALVAVLGITAFVIGKTLSPMPPASFFIVDAILTVVVFLWYVLGMRCRMDVAESWVHVATKYSDFHAPRDRIEAVEIDESVWGALQWSGRPLLVHYRDEKKERSRVRRAFGCLPNHRIEQDEVVQELQEQLGTPEDAHRQELSENLAKRLESMEAEPDGTD